jgi:ribosomal protein L18
MARRRQVRVQVRRTVKVTARRTWRVKQTHQARLTGQRPAAPAKPSPAPPAQVGKRTAMRSLAPGRSPVREVADNLGELIQDTPREFDVFISHASEDKHALVRPLAEALRDAGLRRFCFWRAVAFMLRKRHYKTIIAVNGMSMPSRRLFCVLRHPGRGHGGDWRKN